MTNHKRNTLNGRMLSTVMTQEPTWNLVGSPDSEFVHTVTVVGDSAPYLWRTGFEAWSEDMISAGADRDLLRVIMDQLLKARAGAHQWIVAKLSKEASTTAADDKGYAGLLTARSLARSLAPLAAWRLFSLLARITLWPLFTSNAYTLPLCRKAPRRYSTGLSTQAEILPRRSKLPQLFIRPRPSSSWCHSTAKRL